MNILLKIIIWFPFPFIHLIGEYIYWRKNKEFYLIGDCYFLFFNLLPMKHKRRIGKGLLPHFVHKDKKKEQSKYKCRKIKG